MTRQRRVHIGDGDDRAIEAEKLAERTHRDRVRDPGHPPVDGVECRRGDHDGAGLGHAFRLMGLPPSVADGEAGDGFKQRRVDEREGLWGSGDGDLQPSACASFTRSWTWAAGGAAQTIT